MVQKRAWSKLRRWAGCALAVVGPAILPVNLVWGGSETDPRPTVADPIADYLAMRVPDREANAWPLLVLKTETVDVDGDGQPEVFVGTWYRRSGPDTWLWVGYTPVPGGYRRITAPDADVLIDFAGIYVGPIPALGGREGMVQGYSLELDNRDRQQSNLLSDVTFYTLEQGRLVEHPSGPLDRDDPEGGKVYAFFFGSERRARATPQEKSFNAVDLTRLGYHLPGH